MKIRQLALSITTLLTLASTQAYAATEIQFWHAMTGALNDRVNGIVDDFNKSQSDYKVTAVYKGSYPETLNAGIAAFRANQAPEILQVFEVGTATMMYAKGAVKPVETMMKEAGSPINHADFIPAVSGYYTSKDGIMMSLPFNSSTPVLYYNKDAFTKAGLDANKPPKTWEEIEAASTKLKTAGLKCGYITTWPAWIQFENFSAWHNVEFATKNNGFNGLDARLAINTPLHLKHVEFLAKMAKDGTFTYGGRTNEATARFIAGECGMLTESSGGQANIGKNAKFKFGISTLPYHAGVKGAPQNSIIGGASLWVFANKSPEKYKAVTAFFKHLSKPEVQAKWHQETGYLPITIAAYELTKKSGFYEKNPGAAIPVQQMIVKTTDKSRGVRLGNLPQIRDIIQEELENVLTGKQDAQTALKRATDRSNDQLTRFQRSAK